MTTDQGAGDVLYAEDLVEGVVYELGIHRVSAAEIVEFGRSWDPLPMHVDEHAARRSPLGGLIASGIHTLAIYQRLQADALIARLAVVAGREVRARLVRLGAQVDARDSPGRGRPRSPRRPGRLRPAGRRMSPPAASACRTGSSEVRVG